METEAARECRCEIDADAREREKMDVLRRVATLLATGMRNLEVQSCTMRQVKAGSGQVDGQKDRETQRTDMSM
jgi:hypothetical protein